MKWNEGFFSEILHSAKVTRLISDPGETVAALARANAQVDTGAYRDGIHMKIVSTPTRNIAVIVASDPKSLIIEARTGNLAKALGQVVGRG